MLTMCGRSAPQRGRKLGRGVEFGLVRVHTPGQPLRDFLEQPQIAVGIGEGGERLVASPLWIESWYAAARAVTAVEDLAHFHAIRDKFGTCRFDVIDQSA